MYFTLAQNLKYPKISSLKNVIQFGLVDIELGYLLFFIELHTSVVQIASPPSATTKNRSNTLGRND